MRVFVTTLNKYGEDIHPVAHRVATKLSIYDKSFQLADELSKSDCVFAGTPIMRPYDFNKELATEIEESGKPVILFNESDGGPPESHVIPFENWARGTGSIKACFYREWHKGYERPDLKFPLITFDLPDYLGVQPLKDDWIRAPQTEAEFNARPVDVFFTQSVHVQSRKSFLLNVRAMDDPRWVANDYYEYRIPFSEMMDRQGNSKITVALEGSGIKCQKHCECCINSVMAMHSFDMHETYPWIDGNNCIKLPLTTGGEFNRGTLDVAEAIEKLKSWLNNKGLYRIYLNGLENAKRYSLKNYCVNHIIPNVLKYV